MSDYASTSSRPASPIGDLPNIPTARAFRFNWDATTPRRAGPGSISETTEGRGDYFSSNAPFNLYSTSETSLQLGALPAEWSSSIHGFHAISTVVNNPHRRSAPPKAHSSLPAVPPVDLPRVRRKDFDSYLRSVAPEWERFEKNAEQGREGAAQIDGPSSSQLPSAYDDIPRTPRTPRPPPGKPLPPLESVPDIYFDPNFNLQDPRTFNEVTEHRDEHSSDFWDPSSITDPQPLLETMSHHADTIEQHLIQEISLRSTSFFAALSNLQDLQSESEQCLSRISNLRGLLKEVDEKGAKKGLEIVHMESKLRNMVSMKEGIKVVSGVVEMTSVAKSLVAAGQWGEALDVIDELNSLWDAESNAGTGPSHLTEHSPPSVSRKDGRSNPLPTVPESPPGSPVFHHSHHKPSAISVPISSLQAFASLPSHLRDLTMEITSSLSSELVNVLRLDLIERIDSDSGASEPKRGGLQMSLKDRLRPLLQSLVRTEGVREAAIAWKEVVTLEVQNVPKRRIPAFDLGDDDLSSTKSAEIAKQLCAMSHSAFMDLVKLMYRCFLNCIEGLQAQGNIIIEVLEGIRLPKSSIDTSGLREDLADILSSAGELANYQASKVFNIRAEQHTALDLPSFYALFNVSWDFVVKSEVICKRMIVALRGVIVSQAKSFLQAFHQTRLSQSAKLVEDEQWNPAEVAPTIQRFVDMIVDASISDPRELLFNAPPPNPTSPLPPSSPMLSPTPNANGVFVRPSSPLPSPAMNRAQTNGTSPRRSASSPGKHLKIEDRHYFAVSATLDVLVILIDYLKVIMNLPMLTTDTMSRVIELLKAFNSRTCQVVLGAGAMRSAGLKNITAKHLALASQSLSIMISLIPYVRETFRRHLSPKQAVMLVEFDKLKRDYQEHQNEIHAKLIAIMGDRLTAHIRTLQAIRWDVPKQGDGVNDYMELLVKETVTLHKVLSRYLSASVVEYVMTQVFAAINHRLSEEYTKIELPSQEAKDRLLADARYLHQKLTGLKNVGAPTAMLELVISEKSIARKAPPTPQHTSRLKGMLHRSDSMNVKKVPTPVVPDFEKALPPPSPTPAIQSVTPSPLPPFVDTKVPSPVDPGTQQPPDTSPIKVPETPPSTENPETQQTTSEPEEPGAHEVLDGVNGTTVPPPPTPPKSEEIDPNVPEPSSSPPPPPKDEPVLQNGSADPDAAASQTIEHEA